MLNLECCDCKKTLFVRKKLSGNNWHYRCQWCGIEFDGPGIYYKGTDRGSWRRTDVYKYVKNIVRK